MGLPEPKSSISICVFLTNPYVFQLKCHNPGALNTPSQLFTNDAKLVATKNDQQLLQISLDSARSWSVSLEQHLNGNQCTHLCIGATYSSPLHFDFNDKGSSSTRVSELKDLDVVVICCLTFSAQCKAAFNTAR